jgi:peptide/nickel transport system substrate-binding protein
MKNDKYINFLNTFTHRQWILFYVGLTLVLFSIIFLLYSKQKSNLIQVPVSGDEYKEGIIGNIRFINPVLSVTDNEKEMANLVFKGLFGKDENGNIIPVLAESYEMSEDGLIYTVKIKDDIYFHNKKAITSQDVIYTVKQIQDPIIKSPKQISFSGVEIREIDTKTVEFKLKQRYADFLDTLSVGILSKDEWKDVHPEQFLLSEKNLNPVGNGPYKVDEIKQIKGIPEKIYLSRYKKYVGGKPYIKKIVISFFDTEKSAISALNAKEIDTIYGLTPENINLLDKNTIIEKSISSRLFGLFFNSSKEAIFQDHNVIDAIEYAINKNDIIEKVFNGYAYKKDNAIPNLDILNEKVFSIDKATEIMEKSGWKKNTDGVWEKNKTELKFTLTTTDIEELKLISVLLQEQLESFGARVLIKTYDTTSFSQEVLNERNYQVILFGQVVNKPSSLYSYWHSNERKSPGLNITMYANHKVDTLLEKIKKENNIEKQNELLLSLNKELEVDKPVIFLFQPMNISVSKKEIFNRKYNINLQTSRFFNINLWSIETDFVWKIFTK